MQLVKDPAGLKMVATLPETEEAKMCIRDRYREHQENIRQAGQLRAEINKGVQAGEPIYKLLLTAIECISLMTGEKLFYDMNKDNLQTIYGLSLIHI